MTDTTQNSSNRLSAAEERLARAMNRLEQALSNRATNSGVDPQLNAQLQSLQDDNAKLRALVDSTAQRLDGTIAEFKSKLAG